MTNASSTRDRQLTVIGCGLPRTGTTSLGVALGILLQGPVFDGGALSFSGTKQEQTRLLQLADHLPVRMPADRSFVLYRLAQLTAGCVASVDQPGCFMLEEMLTLYPGAVVVCTTRDEEGWWASYATLWTCIHKLYPLSWLSPQLSRFCRFSYQFWKGVPSAVGIPEGPAWPLTHHKGLYDAHAAYVQRVVPAEQLHYFDVKEGWEPLCRILSVPVPDVPFPHEFPRNSLKQGKKQLLAKLRLRLLALVLGCAMLLSALYWIS